LEEKGVANGVVAIEWPDRLTHALAGATTISIDIVDDMTRRITASS
jgi:tRNA A37 threonylcarbamoyladenosine biosynthesis protein TsaE